MVYSLLWLESQLDVHLLNTGLPVLLEVDTTTMFLCQATLYFTIISTPVAISVVLYHLGCYAEYKLKLKDTARVVPVHAVCGLWSLLAIGIFQTDGQARCNLHAAYEGLCYCRLRLPTLVLIFLPLFTLSLSLHALEPRRSVSLSAAWCYHYNIYITAVLCITLWNTLHTAYKASYASSREVSVTFCLLLGSLCF